MANSRSAAKRARQIKTRTAANRVLTGRIKASRKNLLSQIEANDTAAASETFKEFTSAVDRAAKKGIIHRNKAANLKSKANAALKKAAVAS